MDESCKIPLSEQAQHLATLEPGWLDGVGPAYGADFLGQAVAQIAEYVAQHALPNPYLFPTEDGDVRAEFQSVDLVLEVDRAGVLHVWDIS